MPARAHRAAARSALVWVSSTAAPTLLRMSTSLHACRYCRPELCIRVDMRQSFDMGAPAHCWAACHPHSCISPLLLQPTCTAGSCSRSQVHRWPCQEEHGFGTLVHPRQEFQKCGLRTLADPESATKREHTAALLAYRSTSTKRHCKPCTLCAALTVRQCACLWTRATRPRTSSCLQRCATAVCNSVALSQPWTRVRDAGLRDMRVQAKKGWTNVTGLGLEHAGSFSALDPQPSASTLFITDLHNTLKLCAGRQLDLADTLAGRVESGSTLHMTCRVLGGKLVPVSLPQATVPCWHTQTQEQHRQTAHTGKQ